MRRRKKIHTDFIKFILEKYSQEDPEPDEEMIFTDDEDETEVPYGKKRFKPIEIPLSDEEEELYDYDDETEEDDDMIIERLLKEYQKLKRTYENIKIRNRRR